MKKNHVRVWLISVGCIAMLSTACSVRKKADKYHYLGKKRSTTDSYAAQPHQSQYATNYNESSASNDYYGNNNSYSKRTKNQAVKNALGFMGTPYRYGGINHKGMDCSGLIYVSYQKAGLQLPRASYQLAKSGKRINRNQLRPGDLLFFNAKKKKSVDHVGMVTAVQGRRVDFIHSTSSRGVRLDKLNEGYWSDKFLYAVSVSP